MTTSPAGERFQTGAEKYAAYLETPEGRLRTDLAFANVQEFLQSQAGHSLNALDIGGGTGAVAVRLARLGLHVTLVEPSREMLDIAGRASKQASVEGKIALKHGDANQLQNLFDAHSFDVILCHNVLEYVDDANAVLRNFARLMRDSSSVLSVLVRNRAGEVLKSAILGGDLEDAEKNLTAESVKENLYGGRSRLFSRDALLASLKAASLEAIALRGVRSVSDYLPAKVNRNHDYDRIFELERELGRRADFAAVARYIHCLARCVNIGEARG
jgi:S-adenosylmethionine-dependent methyltransferase